MPSRLIENENGVRAGRHCSGDLLEMQGHRLGIAGRKDEGCALAVLRTDGAEDIGRGGALIARRGRPCAALRPTPRDLVLLADAGLVAEPDFYRLAARARAPDIQVESKGFR